jgi:C4-dicarboxylate-specific signal transduction histidine kinase
MSRLNWDAEIELSGALETIQDQQAKLTQSARMSALGEMASGVGHEVNNPLMIAMANLERMRRELESNTPIDKEKMRATLDKALKNTDRIGKIVRGLRAISRDGSRDDFERASLTVFLQEAIELCAERFRLKGIALRMEIPPENIFVKARPVQISQVVVNLLNNSADAIEGQQNPWVELSLKRDAGKLIVRVSDSGRGIPDEVVSKLMQPFFTTKEVGKGTGLGLSISRNIAKEHGGDLYYALYRGHTSFVLSLPEATEEVSDVA